MNSDFHRIAKRKKAFFNEQCKEIEGNNRKGKTRDLFKKIGNIKGIFEPVGGDRSCQPSKVELKAASIFLNSLWES